MHKLAIASTYSGVGGPSSDNDIVPRTTQSSSNQPQLSPSSFSNTYTSFFALPAIPYSTPTPSFAENTVPHIKEIPNSTVDNFTSTAAPVGAVLPSSNFQPFALLGDSDTSGSTEDVSPLSVPHLIWKGQIWNSDDVQVPYDCLLDDGAHLVLIRPETVTDLGLPIRRLSAPVSVTLALNNNQDSLTELWDYVFLSLSSLNNA